MGKAGHVLCVSSTFMLTGGRLGDGARSTLQTDGTGYTVPGSQLLYSLCLTLVWSVIGIVSLVASGVAHGQEVVAWEYNPYKIHCWLAIDPSLGWNEETLKRVSEEAIASIETRFGPAAEVTSERMPSDFEGDILYAREGFTLDTLLGRELVLAVSNVNAEGKEARSYDAVLQKFQSIAINSSYIEGLRERLAKFPDFKEGQEIGKRIKAAEGLETDKDGKDPVATSLIKGDIPVALVTRAVAKSTKSLRLIPLVYPWQLQSELSNRDKILTMCFRRTDVGVSIEVREIDCMFRTIGKPYQSVVTSHAEFGGTIASLSSAAFIPFARLESADDVTARVRVRAGELIPTDSVEFNPCYIGKGDVLRPTIRRNALNGEPNLIQVIPWTYIVAYDKQSSNLDCAIYSGVRGSLSGRPNRRLLRMALLVRPTFESTDLKLRVAKTKQPVPGNSVFRRTPGREDLELLGRSDWRGVFQIKEHDNPIVQYELSEEQGTANTANAKPNTNASAPAADSKPPENVSQPSESNPEKNKESQPESVPNTQESKPQQAVAESKPAAPLNDKPPMGEVRANVPLYIYFIKSGNALLAKVPIVTGDEPLQIAELADDSKRLEAEALVRGLEGRIFDVVALRMILAQKIENAIDVNTPASLKEAQKFLSELKTTKNYDSFDRDLDAIQKRILFSQADIPKGAQKRIDKMFIDTRTSLQKYLQNDDVRKLEVRLIESSKAAGLTDSAANGN